MALRLLTYNVRYATLDTGENAWERRRDGVGSLVRFHDPDVVCLQEVWQTTSGSWNRTRLATPSRRRSQAFSPVSSVAYRTL